MKSVWLGMTIAALALTAAFPAGAASPLSAGKWSDEILDRFAKLPVQDEGRVKPLDTYASFLMLRINGKRSFEPEGAEGRGDYLSPMEWFLDSLFYPEVAVKYPHFLVDNADAVTTLGLPRHEKQRDRYTYEELEPAMDEMFRRAEEIRKIEAADRTATEGQIIALWQNVQSFQLVISYLEFARDGMPQTDSRLIGRIFGEDVSEIGLSDVMSKNRDVQLAIAAIQQIQEQEGEDSPTVQRELEGLNAFFFPMDMARALSIGLRLIPPASDEREEWWTPSEMVIANYGNQPLDPQELDPQELALLGGLEKMARTAGSDVAFRQAVEEFSSAVVMQAKERGEYGKIPLEVSLYRAKPFFYAQVLFVLSFVIAAISWLNLRSRWLFRLTAFAVAVPWFFLVGGIVTRCIIRSRPPISTLYETILFITATAVLVAGFIEFINRQRIALSAATFLGALGMFIANRYEIINQQDTMPQLVAVLDTNFWLATHVTIINVGYAAGLLAAGIAHFYIIGKLLGIASSNKRAYRNITRMVYGVTCFGLLFAFVGTVLGGIWANYSWGRFWGWDPKENGAAMICLCQLAMLHARMGGYIREIGMHIAAIFTGCVVGFSWWGVNLLGVGLHSYGFTSGIWTATYIFWGVEGLMMLLGIVVFLRDRFLPSRREEEPASGEPQLAK